MYYGRRQLGRYADRVGNFARGAASYYGGYAAKAGGVYAVRQALKYAAGSRRKAYVKNAPSAKVLTNTGARNVKAGKAKLGLAPKSKSKVQSLKKDVKAIKKQLATQLSHFSYRACATGRVLAAVSSKSYANVVATDIAFLETALANGRFFDPAVPGTLVTASLVAGTYSQKVRIVSQYTKVVFRNNYQVPCKLQVMAWLPKDDTSIASSTAFTSGLADNASGALTATDPQVYPSDSKQLTELYKLDKSAKTQLQPGEEFEFIYTFKECWYDPSFYDSHNLSYQSSFGGVNIDCTIQGVLGHDSVVTTEQGLLQAGCDYVVYRTVRVEYDAGGVDLNYVVTSTTLDSFTNGGLVSSKPVADNIAYSLL